MTTTQVNKTTEEITVTITPISNPAISSPDGAVMKKLIQNYLLHTYNLGTYIMMLGQK